MYHLRRAAVRAISQSSTRQLSTLRPSAPSRIVVSQISKPTLFRPFHQSRLRRAEEDENKKAVDSIKDASASAAERAEDAAEAAQEAADDASAQAAASETPDAEPAVQEAQEVAEGESSIAAEAAADAAKIEAALNKGQQSAAAPAPSNYPPEPPQPASQFPPQTSGSASASDFGTPTPTRILYIGNLFFEVTAAHLEAEFGRYGNIMNSRVVTDARGLSKGFGYIEFSEQSAADQAVRELDQKVFQGRRMAVQYHVRRERRGGPQRRQANEPSKTLFIGNMSYQMSDRDLNDLFREVKDVLDVRVAIDRRSGQPRGFAHADFIDVGAAERAKDFLEKKVIYGRQLRVDYSASSSQVKTM